MQLVAFSARHYRSIVDAYKLPVGNYTVLVGPNNEGKSNIVKAIALSLTFLTKGRLNRISRSIRARHLMPGSEFDFDYDWVRDFPVTLQQRYPTGRSEFTLEFELTEQDFQEFAKQVGVKLNTHLKIKLGLGPEDISVDILMKGMTKQSLNLKRSRVIDFVRTHVSTQYVSALRPTQMALEIVDELVEGELRILEDQPQYRMLVQAIETLQQPILDKIAQKLKTTVSGFIPGVRRIRITNERLRRAFRTNFNIMVDDGVNTELASKGDGIISLAAMALAQHVSAEGLGGKSLILLIEEPESHLHPQAIHGLRLVLKGISEQQQVIVTTHSPILVERETVRRNIIVRGGRAVQAKTIADIRDALGVQMADNLVGASLVLLVEGETDRNLLSFVLPSRSVKQKDALKRNLLVIYHMRGASNLLYKASLYKQGICSVHVFMDNDDEGRGSISRAVAAKVLEPSDYNLTKCAGMRVSEIEDLLEPSAYVDAVQRVFGVNLDQPEFHSSKEKWSDRVRRAFDEGAKMWDDSIKMAVKQTVIDSCVAFGTDCLNAHRQHVIDALIEALESKLARQAG